MCCSLADHVLSITISRTRRRWGDDVSRALFHSYDRASSHRSDDQPDPVIRPATCDLRPAATYPQTYPWTGFTVTGGTTSCSSPDRYRNGPGSLSKQGPRVHRETPNRNSESPSRT
nr:hypothetical protein CFP56_72524 [Quercus suber]